MANVARTCDAGVSRAERDGAWRALLAQVGPRLEHWAHKSPVLRRCELATDDDVRTVMVRALERLAERDFANLRAFLARRKDSRLDPPVAGGLVDEVARLAKISDDVDPCDSDDPERSLRGDDTTNTPFRAWLLGLVKFVERDYVRERLGWGTDGAASKREVNTNAERWQEHASPGTRPAITDAIAMARVVADVRAHISSFPDEMRRAVELWSDDLAFEEIGAAMGVSEGRARALVRAGHARLRERFRNAWPTLFPAR